MSAGIFTRTLVRSSVAESGKLARFSADPDMIGRDQISNTIAHFALYFERKAITTGAAAQRASSPLPTKSWNFFARLRLRA
jgi:hypothetical protein